MPLQSVEFEMIFLLYLSFLRWLNFFAFVPFFFQSLRDGTLPRDLPNVYSNLHRISILLYFDCMQEILAVIYFLQSAPIYNNLISR